MYVHPLFFWPKTWSLWVIYYHTFNNLTISLCSCYKEVIRFWTSCAFASRRQLYLQHLWDGHLSTAVSDFPHLLMTLEIDIVQWAIAIVTVGLWFYGRYLVAWLYSTTLCICQPISVKCLLVSHSVCRVNAIRQGVNLIFHRRKAIITLICETY